MLAIKDVIDVISFDDTDKTCIDGIKKAKIKYSSYNIKFANGGDRQEKTTPNHETKFCKLNNIDIIWGMGGNNKSNSSSWILKKWSEN